MITFSDPGHATGGHLNGIFEVRNFNGPNMAEIRTHKCNSMWTATDRLQMCKLH
jgi:hypothetical protein